MAENLNGRNLPAPIDQETGVVLMPESAIPDQVIAGTALGDMLQEFREDRSMPVHLVQLLKRGFSSEIEEALVSLFLGKAFPFDDVVNCNLLVYGMILYQHPGYQGKDGMFHAEGYYQVRFLVERDENLIVVSSASVGLAMIVASILKNRGWWLFAEPILYHFYKSDLRHCIANKVTNYQSVIKGRK